MYATSGPVTKKGRFSQLVWDCKPLFTHIIPTSPKDMNSRTSSFDNLNSNRKVKQHCKTCIQT